jgi:hypothetical protein
MNNTKLTNKKENIIARAINTVNKATQEETNKQTDLLVKKIDRLESLKIHRTAQNNTLYELLIAVQEKDIERNYKAGKTEIIKVIEDFVLTSDNDLKRVREDLKQAKKALKA